MRKKAFMAVGIILVLILVYFVGSDFIKNTSVFVNDYTVSADGREIMLNVSVASSAGYVRDVAVHQQQGGKV